MSLNTNIMGIKFLHMQTSKRSSLQLHGWGLKWGGLWRDHHTMHLNLTKQANQWLFKIGAKGLNCFSVSPFSYYFEIFKLSLRSWVAYTYTLCCRCIMNYVNLMQSLWYQVLKQSLKICIGLHWALSMNLLQIMTDPGGNTSFHRSNVSCLSWSTLANRLEGSHYQQ